jgi:hypothetical protein
MNEDVSSFFVMAEWPEENCGGVEIRWRKAGDSVWTVCDESDE